MPHPSPSRGIRRRGHWSLPAAAAAPDRLKAQINIYHDSIILRIHQEGATFARMISLESRTANRAALASGTADDTHARPDIYL